MPYASNIGLGGVSNQYGVRPTNNAIGAEKSLGGIQILKIQFTGESLNEVFMPPVVLPRGARPLRYVLRVDEVFSLGGTSPTVIFGGTAPATNGVVLSQAELQALGTRVPASAGTGTWSTTGTGTTAAERVNKALGGTTPTVSPTQGRATLFVEYAFATKV